MNLEKTIKNLEARHFKVSHFASGAEAADYLAQALQGQTVGIGGSKTVDQIGLFDKLEEGKAFWHWKVPGDATYAAAATADAYVSGANAISEDGEIFSIDGRGNRVATQLFGHKKVYFVIGKNKLAEDYDKALWRARNIAGPKNAQRLGRKTPCAAKADRCYNCSSPDRICKVLSVFWGAPMGADCEVVLIKEDLGY